VRAHGGEFSATYFHMHDNIAGSGFHLDGADAYVAVA
jgi:hypothetical protein